MNAMDFDFNETQNILLNSAESFLAKEAKHHSGGRMMLDHFCDKKRRIPLQSSVVGSQFLQATGVALSIKMQNKFFHKLTKKRFHQVYTTNGKKN